MWKRCIFHLCKMITNSHKKHCMRSRSFMFNIIRVCYSATCRMLSMWENTMSLKQKYTSFSLIFICSIIFTVFWSHITQQYKQRATTFDFLKRKSNLYFSKHSTIKSFLLRRWNKKRTQKTERRKETSKNLINKKALNRIKNLLFLILWVIFNPHSKKRFAKKAQI